MIAWLYSHHADWLCMLMYSMAGARQSEVLLLVALQHIAKARNSLRRLACIMSACIAQACDAHGLLSSRFDVCDQLTLSRQHMQCSSHAFWACTSSDLAVLLTRPMKNNSSILLQSRWKPVSYNRGLVQNLSAFCESEDTSQTYLICRHPCGSCPVRCVLSSCPV